jgi:hypothetical protein
MWAIRPKKVRNYRCLFIRARVNCWLVCLCVCVWGGGGWAEDRAEADTNHPLTVQVGTALFEHTDINWGCESGVHFWSINGKTKVEKYYGIYCIFK